MNPTTYRPASDPDTIAQGLREGWIVPATDRVLSPSLPPQQAASGGECAVTETPASLKRLLGDSERARLDYTPQTCSVLRKGRKYTAQERQCWRTPNTPEQPVLWLVAQALGGEIGLDPTADDARSVPAHHHITSAQNCLVTPWYQAGAPKNAFMNPQFDAPHLYLERLIDQHLFCNISEAIALLKIGALANQKTGAMIANHAAAVCCWGAGKPKANGRIAFIDCDGNQVRGGDFDSCLVYFGRQRGRFLQVFADYGLVSKVVA